MFKIDTDTPEASEAFSEASEAPEMAPETVLR